MKGIKIKVARKKTRIIGTQTYLNASTGELLDMSVVETDEKDVDTNFHKLFMKDFLASLDIVSNQKTKVAFWIIDNITKDNRLLYSYRQISEQTGISYQTIAVTIKTLKDADFLREDGKTLIVNPDIIFKGTASRRQAVAHIYGQAQSGDKAIDTQKRIDNIKKTITNLQKQLAQLEKK